MVVPRWILEPGCFQQQPQLPSSHTTDVRLAADPAGGSALAGAEQGCVPQSHPREQGHARPGLLQTSALLSQYHCKGINIHMESLEMSHISVPSNC